MHVPPDNLALTVGDAEQAIGPGPHSIEERRVLLVLFAPAESGG